MASKAKKPGRKQPFKDEYTQKWDFIVKSRRDKHSARCNICSCDFSIAHGGRNDIDGKNGHLNSMKHKNAAKAVATSYNLATQFATKAEFSVIRAETLMVCFLIEHNLPFADADHFSDLVKKMFPDSTIASKFSCRRTKATSIAKTLGQESKGNIISKLRQTPFSLSTDGSSDRGADEQLYPVVVRYFDTDVNQVLSVLVEIAVTKDASTGNNIFLLLDKIMQDNKILWRNVICFAADNAAVMMGVYKGVAAFVKKQNPDVFIMGCPCHLIHLAAEKGCSQLPFSPVSLLIPIFYYMAKSTKRHKEFQKMQKLCNVETHAILKHVCTRWLSLQRALDRLLEQWVPLTLFFKEEAESVQTKRKAQEEDTTVKPKKPKLLASKVGSSSRVSSTHKATSASKRTPGVGMVKGSVGKTTCVPHSTAKKGSVSVQKPGSVPTSHLSTSKASQGSKISKKSVGISPSVMKKTSGHPLHTKKAISTTSTASSIPKFSASKEARTITKTTSSAMPAKRTLSAKGTSSTKKSTESSTTKSTLSPTTKNTVSPTTKSTVSPTTKSTSATSKSTSAPTKSSSSATSKSTSSRPSGDSKAVAADIWEKLSNQYNKLYCVFLQHTIPVFNKVNLELQEEAPKIHVLQNRLRGLLKSLLLRFVKPKAIAECSPIEKCDYKSECNQKCDGDLVLGKDVRELLRTGDFSDSQKEEFFASVRKYFVTVCDYIVAKFPLSNDLLYHANVANPLKRQEMSFSSVAYFVKRFHFMEENLDDLEIEFANYQVDSFSDELISQRRVDAVWVDISRLKDESGSFKYLNLSKVMFIILSIAHSNAEDERIFSMARKNSTEFRANLAVSTLSNVLTFKVHQSSQGTRCYDCQLSNKILQKCKTSTAEYNKSLAQGVQGTGKDVQETQQGVTVRQE